MARERLKSPRARLFVALDLPSALREGIDAWGRRELRDPALRVVPPESLHITLAFLGYMPEKEIEPLAEIVAALGTQAPTIELGDPLARPNARRARLFALPAASPVPSSCRRSCRRSSSGSGCMSRRSGRSGRTSRLPGSGPRGRARGGRGRSSGSPEGCRKP